MIKRQNSSIIFKTLIRPEKSQIYWLTLGKNHSKQARFWNSQSLKITKKAYSTQSHERKVGNRRWRHWTKISAKSVTKKNPCLPSTFSSKMPPCEMFVYFRNFLKKHLVTPYSSNGSGLEDKNRSFSFFSLIEKNSKHISSSIFSRLKLWQRINRTKNWRLTKIS